LAGRLLSTGHDRMVRMNQREMTETGMATRLAFAALARSVDGLFERHARDARPGFGIEGDIHLKVFSEPSQELFDDLARLAQAGLDLVERNRQWVLAEGLRDGECDRFWYDLALAASKAASGHADSTQKERVSEEPIRILFSSLLEFLPYACIQPGDWVIRIADALVILHAAFPLDGLRELARQAEHSAKTLAGLLSAVGEKMEENLRAARPRSST
jgi:hypothetical protein